MMSRAKYRLIQMTADHSRDGLIWEVGDYEGEQLNESPPRVTPLVRLYHPSAEGQTLDVPGSWVRPLGQDAV